MSYQHAVVWVDHQHATVIDFNVDDKQVVTIASETGQRKLHRRSGIPGSGKAAPDHVFYDEVALALGSAREVLIVGPGNAKTEFHRDLQGRHSAIATRVVGIESVDHPSDGELLAYAKKYFKRIDALRGDG